MTTADRSEFKQRHFWATHINRKWAFFSVNKPWRHQICSAKCLNAYRDDLHKHLGKRKNSDWRGHKDDDDNNSDDDDDDNDDDDDDCDCGEGGDGEGGYFSDGGMIRKSLFLFNFFKLKV